MVKLVENPIDPSAVYDSICSAYSGSVVFHYAVVKKQAGSGSSTSCIEYRAQDDTILELEGIAQELEQRWKLEEDAISTLDALKDQGMRLGLVSNAGDAQDVHTLIDRHHLRPYFEQVIVSALAGVRKPNPRIFKLALDKFNVGPENAVMVGDTLGADILGAKNAGIASVWIMRRAYRSDNRAHEDTIRPDAVIARLSELPPLLAKGF